VPLLSGSSSAEIAAPRQRCWEVVAAVERWPEWQSGLQRVEVVERDAEARPVVCDTFSEMRFLKLRCRVSIVYAPPERIAFARLESEDVEAMEGAWELEDIGGGRTRAGYRLALDPGPVPRLARPLVNALRPLVVGNRPGELARALGV
jgi:uncharacterized protein YndB with AHSA1/START domain